VVLEANLGCSGVGATRWQQRVAAPTPAEPPSGARVCPGYGNGNLGTARVQQQRGKSVSRRVTMTARRWKQLRSDWVTRWLGDIRSGTSTSLLLHGVIMGRYLQMRLRRLEPGEP